MLPAGYLTETPEQAQAQQAQEPGRLFTLELITSMFTGKCPHLLPAAPATQPCESRLQSQLPVILLIYVEQL